MEYLKDDTHRVSVQPGPPEIRVSTATCYHSWKSRHQLQSFKATATQQLVLVACIITVVLSILYAHLDIVHHLAQETDSSLPNQAAVRVRAS